MIRPPPCYTLNDTLLPYPPLFRSRPDRAFGQGGDRGGHSVPAGHGDGGRHHARAGHGAVAFQILPGRDFGRAASVEGAGGALAYGAILPDRRDHGGKRAQMAGGTRSEERRVGKEGVSTCISRWEPEH